MAAIAIKEEEPDTHFPKTPTIGVDATKLNEEKTKTAPKVIKYVDRKKGNGFQDNGPTMSAKQKMQKNGLHKDLVRIFGNKKHNVEATRPLDDASRCGEIFVTKNTKKWTFVCTFCQKSTRDIGEFVCHIKFKHMNYPYNEDDDDAGGIEIANEYASQSENLTDNSGLEETYNQAQDYIDCTNYLDVNVHTEEQDETPPFKGDGLSLFKPIASAKQSQIETNSRRSNDVVNLLDDEDDEYEDDINETNRDPSDNEPMFYDYEYDGQDTKNGIQLIDHMDDETDQMDDDKTLLALRRPSTEGGDSNTAAGMDFKNDIKQYRSHVKGTAYCELCNKTFQYYSLYRNHMIKHTNVTPFKCQFCSKGFKSKQAIRYHMNTHAREKPYACPVCGTTYATASLFMGHVMSHEGENCFPCMVCTKIFKTERGREVHLESHSQERPYVCNFCSKRFRQKHHLSNHLKLHCQYRCDFCKTSFNSTQTQRRPYACQTCEEKPDIRQQVERQRSIPTKSHDPPSLLKFENVMLQSTATMASPEAAVELTSGDESVESNSLLQADEQNNFPQCKYCHITYTHVGALNFHLKQKHPEYFT